MGGQSFANFEFVNYLHYSPRFERFSERQSEIQRDRVHACVGLSIIAGGALLVLESDSPASGLSDISKPATTNESSSETKT